MYLKIYDFVTITLVDPPPELAQHVRQELGYFEVGNDAYLDGQDIVIKFVDRLPTVGGREYISTYAGYDEHSFFIMDHWRHKTTFPFDKLDGHCEVMCERGFSPPDLVLLLENVLRYKLVLKGAVLLHASAVVYQGQGLVFPAWANTGKTNLLLQFLQKGAAYMADDWVIISESGLVYAYPRRLNLFGYNYQEFSWLVDVLQDDTKTQWRRYQASTKLLIRLPEMPLATRLIKFVRRRSEERLGRHVSATMFFPDVQIGSPTGIDKVFLLVRSDSLRTEFELADPKAVASKMVSCLSFERYYHQDYRHLYAFAYPEGVPDLLVRIEDSEKDLIQKAMRDSELHYVRLAENYRSTELFEQVESHLKRPR